MAKFLISENTVKWVEQNQETCLESIANYFGVSKKDAAQIVGDWSHTLSLSFEETLWFMIVEYKL